MVSKTQGSSSSPPLRSLLSTARLSMAAKAATGAATTAVVVPARPAAVATPLLPLLLPTTALVREEALSFEVVVTNDEGLLSMEMTVCGLVIAVELRVVAGAEAVGGTERATMTPAVVATVATVATVVTGDGTIGGVTGEERAATRLVVEPETGDETAWMEVRVVATIGD